MGMKVGELFLDLGVEGSEKTLGLITGVKGGLQSTASEGLAAKAAIVGAMYALQSLFSTSNKTGNDLSNFNSLLGVSTKTLQQYQYAARQVGISNSEMEGTFKGLQSTMTKVLMGESAPKGLAQVAQLTGDIDMEDIQAFANKPELLIQRLQQYAQLEKNVGLRNEVLKSFGIGDGVMAGLTRNAFTSDVLSRAPTYSDSDIKNLDKANAAWSNLGTTIEMAVGKFNAKHGGELVKDITLITEKVIKLSESFITLAEKLKIFELIGKVFEGWGMIFDTINQEVDAQNKTGQKSDTPVLDYLTPKKVGGPKSFGEEFGNVIDFMKSGQLSKVFDNMGRVESYIPKPGQTGGTTTTTVNAPVTINANHSVNDPNALRSTVSEAVKQAHDQMAARAQGN